MGNVKKLLGKIVTNQDKSRDFRSIGSINVRVASVCQMPKECQMAMVCLMVKGC